MRLWRLPSQDGKPAPLLPEMGPEHTGRKCLVLDLDETLLHSSFKVRRAINLLDATARPQLADTRNLPSVSDDPVSRLHCTRRNRVSGTQRLRHQETRCRQLFTQDGRDLRGRRFYGEFEQGE